MKKYLVTLTLVFSFWTSALSGENACEALEVSSGLLNSLYGGNAQSSAQAPARVRSGWITEIDTEIARQRLALQMLSGGPVPPEQFPWPVDEMRYLCTPGANGKKVLVPEPCRFPSDAAVQATLQEVREIIQDNVTAFTTVRQNIIACGVERQKPVGFNLADGEPGTPQVEAAEPSARDMAEPEGVQGRIFWSGWMVEKTPEVSQTVRDSLAAVWQLQVMDGFRDFNALNFENGQGLKPDARMVQEGELTVLYRDGQRILAFYKPQGVYVRVFVEVPYGFQNQLGGASAVSLMLKRTSRGNYSIHEYRQAPSLSEAYDAAFFERSIFQLEAVDQSAEQLLKSISTITKGVESGLERRLKSSKMRYKVAATVIWTMARITGSGVGFLVGSTLAPLFAPYVGPEFARALPGVFMLTGMTMFRDAFNRKEVHKRIMNLFDKDFADRTKLLSEYDERSARLTEFRADVGLLRERLAIRGGCSDLLRQDVGRLLQQGKSLNGL